LVGGLSTRTSPADSETAGTPNGDAMAKSRTQDRQREDVSDPAAVQVIGRGVMNRVTVAPAHKRLVDDQPQRDAKPGVSAFGRQNEPCAQL
jgi:hypothetical protein